MSAKNKKIDKIQQMISFIETEAQEKAEEIRVQGEEEFSVIKQTKVEDSKKVIRMEYEKKEKKVEIEKKIKESNIKKSAKLKLLKKKEELLQVLCTATLEKLRKNSEIFSKFIPNLCLEGMIKVYEKKVRIKCRPEDEKFINKNELLKEYTKLTKETIKELKVDPTLKEKFGVIVFGLGDRIKVDNTLEFRLNAALDGLKPVVNEILFEQ